MRGIVALIPVLLASFTVAAQEKKVTIGASVVPLYYVYEIDGNYYSLPERGQRLMISQKEVRQGKQYFKRKLLKSDRRRRYGQLPVGTVSRPSNSSGLGVDTLVFTGIELKVPIEVNEELAKSKPGAPYLISDFQLVKGCANVPYKHVEVTVRE